MKKIFTLLTTFALATATYAQDYVFTDQQGNVLEDGATIERTETEDDGFGGSFIPGHLYVKNNADNAGKQVAIVTEISQIDNGALQLCFPVNCQSYSEAGTNETAEKASIAVGEQKDLQTEWLFESEGQCIVTYKIKAYQSLASEVVRTLTVKYKYGNSQQVWWGYVSTNTSGNSVGTSTAETYHCAIFIPGNHAIAGGKTIHAIRFGLVAPNAIDAKVWVASSLPSSITAQSTLQYENVPASQLGNENIEVSLTTPVTIPAGGAYVGYSFTIKNNATQQDNYPVLTAGADAPNALLLRTDQMNWGDFNGYGFGSLLLHVLLDGEFADNVATAADFGPAYAVLGGSATTKVNVMNGGSTPISSIDYTITTDGVASAEQHVNLTSPIVFNTTGTINVTIPADETTGQKDKTLNITKVNGQNNANANLAANFTLYTLSKLIDRNVVVEQFTGTGCGWCPRGHVGMEKMRANFGDRFIGIAIHQYSQQAQDAMYIAPAKYAKHGLQGAPSCRLDRGAEADPYYGYSNDILDDFREEMEIPALAEVSVSGTLNTEKTQVEAKAKTTALFDGTYNLEFVLVADGLKGTGTGWAQANYYSSAYASQTGITKASLPDDLKHLYDTGATFYPTFNDVAIASSYTSSKNQVPALTLTAETEEETTFTLTMPTYTKLKNAIDIEQVYVVALLVNAQGKIVNAAKQQITVADPSGIENVNTATNSEQTASYTLDGRRVQTMQKGLNIVRMANGKTIKVIQK